MEVKFRIDENLNWIRTGSICPANVEKIDKSPWLGSRWLLYLTDEQMDWYYECGRPEYVKVPGDKRFHRFWRQPGFVEEAGKLYTMFYVK